MAKDVAENFESVVDYTTVLDNFEGPLDLLLFLIKQEKIEIKDIFVSKVTEQFLDYMKGLPYIDIDKASEYLSIASAILEIKAKSLVPAIVEPESEEEDGEAMLIRALEVRLLTGKSILELQQNPGDTLRYAVRAWKLEIPPELLAERIARRAEAMLDAGWIDEARAAIVDGLLDTPTAHQAIGYRLIAEHLAGHLTENQLLERIVTATRQFARRQRTWFRHQHPEARPLRCPAGAPPSWEALMESPENPPLP